MNPGNSEKGRGKLTNLSCGVIARMKQGAAAVFTYMEVIFN